jgi:hypothetical protein
VRRIKVVLAGLAIAATSFAAMPSNAGGLCYHLKVSFKGSKVLDQWVGACPSSPEVVSSTVQQIGATTVETTRYSG